MENKRDSGYMITLISNSISSMIASIQNIYKNHGFIVQFPKEYLHTTVMSMVSPSTLKLRQTLNDWVTCKPIHQDIFQNDSSFTSSEQLVKQKPIPKKRKRKEEEADEGGYKRTRESCILHPEFEKKLLRWILQKNDQGEIVKRADVQQYALSIKPYQSFKASRGWVKKFAFRNPAAKNCIRQFIPCQIFGSLDEMGTVKKKDVVSDSE